MSANSRRIIYVSDYEAMLPEDIRNKIYNELEIIHKFKLIWACKEDRIQKIFAPFADNDPLENINNIIDAVMLYHICIMRYSDASNIVAYKLDSVIRDMYARKIFIEIDTGHRDPEYITPLNLDFLTSIATVTLSNLSNILRVIMNEYHMGRGHLVDTQMLVVFMKAILQRLCKFPRDLFDDYIDIYTKIYCIIITLLAIHYKNPRPICNSLINILNTYFDGDTLEICAVSMYDILDTVFSLGLAPISDIAGDENEDGDRYVDLCAAYIENIIGDILQKTQ